jgi:hypothetical protein
MAEAAACAAFFLSTAGRHSKAGWEFQTLCIEESIHQSQLSLLVHRGHAVWCIVPPQRAYSLVDEAEAKAWAAALELVPAAEAKDSATACAFPPLADAMLCAKA